MADHKDFPGFDQLFQLGPDIRTGDFAVRFDMSLEDGFSVLRSESAPNHVDAHWISGRKLPGSVIWGPVNTPMLVRHDLLEAFRSRGLTGWRAIRTRVFDKTHTAIPGYSALSIHGRCGEIQENLSVRVQREYSGVMFPELKG